MRVGIDSTGPQIAERALRPYLPELLAAALEEDIRALDPVVAPTRRKTQLDHLLAAYSRAPIGGLACEFGVFRGDSINALAEADESRVFWGFDDFKSGLPEAWDKGTGEIRHPAGHFAQIEPPKHPSNVFLVDGTFAVSIPAFFGQTKLPVDFAHIDSDLYSSARIVLDWIGPRLRFGSVLVFDELVSFDGTYPAWRDGEWKALTEWLCRFGRMLRPISRTGFEQVAFIVTAGN